MRRTPAAAPAPGPLAVEAATALLVAMPWLGRCADLAARAAGAPTSARVRMLMVLTEGSRRGSEIAARWDISRAAVAQAAASLAREGLLRRAPDPDDGRAVRFALTTRGRRAMEAFGKATTTAVAAHLARLGPARQRALAGIAREITASLAADPTVKRRSP
jgi:DNA-binding MarR family transcriptional regulator